MKRVVSLIASSTEIVHALERGDWLVGRSHECDYPPQVAELPVCTAPKFVADGSSREIDRQVRTLVEQGLSVYRVDAERLRELAPEVILTQSQCEVCAVSENDVMAAVAEWVEGRPQVISLVPDDLAKIWSDVRTVAAALDCELVGRRLVDRLQERMELVRERCAARARRPTVACIEWIDPLMAAGNWTPELIERACGENLFGEAGRHSGLLDWGALVSADPEVLIVAPCGFDVPRTLAEMSGLVDRPGWTGLRAVREGRVFLADGNAYFNRPGPRVVETLEIVAEILHPGALETAHEGRGWRRWSDADR